MGWDQSGGVRMKEKQPERSTGEKETPKVTRRPLEEFFGERLAKSLPWGVHQMWRWEIGFAISQDSCLVSSMVQMVLIRKGFLHAQSQLGILEVPSSAE